MAASCQLSGGGKAGDLERGEVVTSSAVLLPSSAAARQAGGMGCSARSYVNYLFFFYINKISLR